MKRTFVMAAAAAGMLALTGAASAQSSASGTGIGTGTGIASAGGGAVGDIINIPGANVGAAYCVDAVGISFIGWSKTMRECVMMELLGQMIGAGTTNHAEARAVQLAIAEELGYRIEYRQVGGSTTSSSRSPAPAEISTPTWATVMTDDGTQAEVRTANGMAALQAGNPVHLSDGRIVTNVISWHQ